MRKTGVTGVTSVKGVKGVKGVKSVINRLKLNIELTPFSLRKNAFFQFGVNRTANANEIEN